MAGTKAGGKKCAIVNKLRHGEDFYKRIGAKGGKNGHTGGFYNNTELAKRAGRIGGMISKRGKAKKKRIRIDYAPTLSQLIKTTRIYEEEL